MGKRGAVGCGVTEGITQICHEYGRLELKQLEGTESTSFGSGPRWDDVFTLLTMLSVFKTWPVPREFVLYALIPSVSFVSSHVHHLNDDILPSTDFPSIDCPQHFVTYSHGATHSCSSCLSPRARARISRTRSARYQAWQTSQGRWA